MANRITIGYKLSSEEFTANELVRLARAAEERGFTFALISDHFHPWTDRQGQSPFVWSVLGGIAQATKRLRVGTAVTCPTTRVHPAIIAQASATVASMLAGRFFLGVGSGESLNEHITGQTWPEVSIRQEKLAEAITIIRQLWRGELYSFHGKHFTVENARIYSLPEQPPPIAIAVAGPKSATIARDLGDALISTQPDGESVEQFHAGGNNRKPCYAEVTVCFDRERERALKLVQEIWPVAALPGVVQQELPLPSQFEKVARLVTQDKLAEEVPCGPDPEKHVEGIQKFIDAGFDHICVHQIGPNQEQFMDFYAEEVFPRLNRVKSNEMMNAPEVQYGR